METQEIPARKEWTCVGWNKQSAKPGNGNCQITSIKGRHEQSWRIGTSRIREKERRNDREEERVITGAILCKKLPATFTQRPPNDMIFKTMGWTPVAQNGWSSWGCDFSQDTEIMSSLRKQCSGSLETISYSETWSPSSVVVLCSTESNSIVGADWATSMRLRKRLGP